MFSTCHVHREAGCQCPAVTIGQPIGPPVPYESPKVKSWRKARHFWSLAPALEVKPAALVFGSLRSTGELYWAPGRRGDVPGRCLRHEGENRLFHPFKLAERPDPLALAS